MPERGLALGKLPHIIDATCHTTARLIVREKKKKLADFARESSAGLIMPKHRSKRVKANECRVVPERFLIVVIAAVRAKYCCR